MASISFRGEAAESFANMLQHIEGYTVRVKPEDTHQELFDATLLGSAADEVDDYYAVRVQRWLDETGEELGDPEIVVVYEIQVY